MKGKLESKSNLKIYFSHDNIKHFSVMLIILLFKNKIIINLL